MASFLLVLTRHVSTLSVFVAPAAMHFRALCVQGQTSFAEQFEKDV